jgi:hypothetical protein
MTIGERRKLLWANEIDLGRGASSQADFADSAQRIIMTKVPDSTLLRFGPDLLHRRAFGLG